MIDCKLRYQASVFVQTHDIRPTPDTTTTLIDIFRDKELIPSTFHEISATSPKPETRLSLSSESGEWNVNFPSMRVNVTKRPTDLKGTNLGDVDAFCLEATRMLDKILERFKKKANRLALITEYLLNEMAESELENAYSKLFKPLKFYAEVSPFEWNWRSASKKAFKSTILDEQLNIITSINRIKGQLGTATDSVSFDRLQLLLDINTNPDNREYRFETEHVDAFFGEIHKLHKSLLDEIGGHLGG